MTDSVTDRAVDDPTARDRSTPTRGGLMAPDAGG